MYRPHRKYSLIPTTSQAACHVVQKGTFMTKTGTFGVPGGPEKARHQAKVCCNQGSNPVRPISGSLDQILSQGALRGLPEAPKGAFRAKMCPFEVPGAQKRPNARPKWMVTLILTQSDQLAEVGTKFGPYGALRIFFPSYGLFEAKWALLGSCGYLKGANMTI